MTVDFNNKNILQISTSNATQIVAPEDNAQINSVMNGYIEEVIEEEALPNIMDDVVPQEEIEEQLQITAKILNTTYEKLKQISEDVLKNNDAFKGKSIEQISRRDLTQFLTAITDAYKTVKEKEEKEAKAIAEEIKQRVDAYTKAIRKGVYDSEIRKNTYNEYANKDILKYIDEIQRKTEEELLVIISMVDSDEERLEMLDLIQKANAESIAKLCSSLMQDFNSEKNQEEFAYRATDVDFIKNCSGNVNIFDLTTGMISQMSRNSCENFTHRNNERTDNFLTNNQKELEIIAQKLNKGEELTEDEENLLKEKLIHFDVNNGVLFGIYNTNFDQNTTDKLTASILNVFNKHDLQNEFTLKIAETALTNPKALGNISLDEFTSRLDNLTDGNYSNIAAEVKANLETQKLISGTSTESAKTSDTKNYEIGFTNNNKEPDLVKYENYKKQFVKNNSIAEDTTPRIVRQSTEPVYTPKSTLKDYKLKYGAFKAFNVYAKEVGVMNALKEAFKDLENTDKTQVKKIYKKQNTTKQADLIKGCGVSAINDLLSWAKNDAVTRLQGTILRTNFATKALKEKNEEIKEEEKANT